MDWKWLDGEDLAEVEPILASHGWSPLNTATARAIGAYEDGILVGFFVLQLYPMLGPMWVDPRRRDGTLSRELTERMDAFLQEVNARGYMVVCDNPVSERLAQRHRMRKIEVPVYVGQEV